MPKDKPLSVREAAQVIGCTIRNVHWLIKNGKIKATRKKVPEFAAGFVYQVSPAEAAKAKELVYSRGWKRGRRRK